MHPNVSIQCENKTVTSTVANSESVNVAHYQLFCQLSTSPWYASVYAAFVLLRHLINIALNQPWVPSETIYHGAFQRYHMSDLVSSITLNPIVCSKAFQSNSKGNIKTLHYWPFVRRNTGGPVPWKQKIVSEKTLSSLMASKLSQWQITASSVSTKLQNWRPFVFDVMLKTLPCRFDFMMFATITIVDDHGGH